MGDQWTEDVVHKCQHCRIYNHPRPHRSKGRLSFLEHDTGANRYTRTQDWPGGKKMGLHGSPTHAVTYEDVRVPLENLIGQEGRGLQQTLATLDGGRISIGAISVGLAQAAMEYAIAYAQERKAFGQFIGEFQAIQFMLADAATEIEAARTILYRAAWLKDQHRPYSHLAAMAKIFATEMAERVCRNSIQIHGGYGYSREYHVERLYRDARLMTIGEGTSEIQRMVIARHVLRSEM